MTKLLKLIDVPALPNDVLRLVFEEAIREDTRKAVKFTLISRLVRNWAEACLYEDVRLYSEKSLRRFLRTLETSTKPKLFFATRVKSLAFAYDIHDFERTARILSVCSGVENLTIWVIPSQNPIDVQLDTGFPHDVYAPQLLYHTSSHLAIHHGHPQQLHTALHTFAHHLRPRRLAVLIDKPFLSPATTQAPHLAWTTAHLSPNFSLGLFSTITHLTIVNRWTEWSTWAWARNSSASPHETSHQRYHSLKFLPRLTHLSVEIQVGKRLMSRNFFSSMDPSASYQGSRKLAERVGHPLARILSSPELNPRLHVLLCVLSFDDTPCFTARSIKEETASNLIILNDELDIPSTQMANLGLDSENECLGDPRLVFAYDKEPFREREAGSYKVWNMWKRAEEIVRLQKHDRGTYDPIVFEL